MKNIKNNNKDIKSLLIISIIGKLFLIAGQIISNVLIPDEGFRIDYYDLKSKIINISKFNRELFCKMGQFMVYNNRPRWILAFTITCFFPIAALHD